jgi:hypothetical protein
MALKDIRVTFFYADEQIFDLVKRWRTRLRLVKWANEFYKRFGFKIDEYPFPYNEKVYRKEFSFTKIKGIRPDYTEAVKMKKVEEAFKLQKEAWQKKVDVYQKSPPTDPVDRLKMQDEIVTEGQEILAKAQEILDFHTVQREFETQFRIYLNVKLLDKKISGDKPRIPVIFCEFVNAWELFAENNTLGQTFNSDGRPAHLIVWAMAAYYGLDLYSGPLILIDVERMTKSVEYALAHELVHAAGNTTPDNQGTKGNIMIYADAQGKSPADVNLETSDKTKLETAFFVK